MRSCTLADCININKPKFEQGRDWLWIWARNLCHRGTRQCPHILCIFKCLFLYAQFCFPVQQNYYFLACVTKSKCSVGPWQPGGAVVSPHVRSSSKSSAVWLHRMSFHSMPGSSSALPPAMPSPSAAHRGRKTPQIHNYHRRYGVSTHLPAAWKDSRWHFVNPADIWATRGTRAIFCDL